MSLTMVVLDVLREHVPKVPFTQRDHAGQALRPHGSNESFGVCVQVGAARRQPHHGDACMLEDLAERARVERIAIEDQVPGTAQEAIEGIGEVAGRLLHPCLAGLAGDACDVHAASPDVDDEENEVANQSTRLEHLDREEVGSSDGAEMGLEERAPGSASAAFGRRLEPVIEEHALDRVSRDLIAEVVEGPPNAGVPPTRIDAGHIGDKLGNRLPSSWPSRLAA